MDIFPSTEIEIVSIPDDGSVEVVKDNGELELFYWPVCNEWQIMKYQHLGLNCIRGMFLSHRTLADFTILKLKEGSEVMATVFLEHWLY